MMRYHMYKYHFFFFQAEDGIRAFHVTGVQTCALPICFIIKILRHMKRKWIISLTLALLLSPSLSLQAQSLMDRMAKKADRKSTRLNSSHVKNSYAVSCLIKKKDPTIYFKTSQRFNTTQ